MKSESLLIARKPREKIEWETSQMWVIQLSDTIRKTLQHVLNVHQISLQHGWEGLLILQQTKHASNILALKVVLQWSMG